jgi:hypothetical protein
MAKIKLNNTSDFEKLKIELKEDEGTEFSFQDEETPTSYPCIAIHHYDVDFGGLYNIEFVYLNDFHPCLKTINLN